MATRLEYVNRFGGVRGSQKLQWQSRFFQLFISFTQQLHKSLDTKYRLDKFTSAQFPQAAFSIFYFTTLFLGK